jgi:Ice-binding-like
MQRFTYGLGAFSRFLTRPVLFVLGLLLALAFAGNALAATAPPLGDAATFGALSSTAMTNSGSNTVVHGNVGSSTSIDAGVTHPGFGAYGAGSPELANAQASLLTAYNFAEAQPPNQATITGANLAGRTLGPGVYNSTSGILISGPIALTLDGGGDSSSVFIFQAASSGDLTVDPTSSVAYTNGAQPCNVFWKVHSAFLKNTGNTFVGTILALTQITLTDNITVEGRVLARNADVTFIHDTVNKPTCTTAPPSSTTSPPTTTLPKAKPKTKPAKAKAKPAKPKATPVLAPPRPPLHHVGLTG